MQRAFGAWPRVMHSKNWDRKRCHEKIGNAKYEAKLKQEICKKKKWERAKSKGFSLHASMTKTTNNVRKRYSLKLNVVYSMTHFNYFYGLLLWISLLIFPYKKISSNSSIQKGYCCCCRALDIFIFAFRSLHRIDVNIVKPVWQYVICQGKNHIILEHIFLCDIAQCHK